MIATQAGITRTRFYHYYKGKHEAMAALLERLAGVLRSAYEEPDSWFVRPPTDERPRAALKRTVGRISGSWWPHRHVLREASDLWTALPALREEWLDALAYATAQLEAAIKREQARGAAPPSGPPARLAEALLWQAERVYFRAYAGIQGAMSRRQADQVTLEIWMRTIYLADDPPARA